MQDAQIGLVCPVSLLMRAPQRVIGHPEPVHGKEIRSVPVVGKRSRTQHQRVDHVTLLDPVLALAEEPRHTLHKALPIPYLDPFAKDSYVDTLTDKLALHRVAVLSHAYRAAPGYPHAVAFVALQAPLWQGPQEGLLLFEALLALRIQLPKQLLEKGLVGLPTLEIVAATKDELVLYGPLQTVVPLFYLPVLMWTRRLRMPRVHPVVAQQCLIAFGEVFTALALQVAYRTAHRVRLMQPGRTCTACCRPSESASKLSDLQTVPASQLEYASTK